MIPVYETPLEKLLHRKFEKKIELGVCVCRTYERQARYKDTFDIGRK